MNRLQEKYNNEIVPAMIEKFGYKNIMQVPKLNKIVINMGVGEAKDNSKVLDSAVKDLEIIAGQKAVAVLLRDDERMAAGDLGNVQERHDLIIFIDDG